MQSIGVTEKVDCFPTYFCCGSLAVMRAAREMNMRKEAGIVPGAASPVMVMQQPQMMMMAPQQPQMVMMQQR